MKHDWQRSDAFDGWTCGWCGKELSQGYLFGARGKRIQDAAHARQAGECRVTGRDRRKQSVRAVREAMLWFSDLLRDDRT